MKRTVRWILIPLIVLPLLFVGLTILAVPGVGVVMSSLPGVLGVLPCA